jgi:hypothetical protein
MRVLVTAGVQSETNLPFAALHRLLRPILTALDRLPRAQAEAVSAALGLTRGPAAEPFPIAAVDQLVDAQSRGACPRGARARVAAGRGTSARRSGTARDPRDRQLVTETGPA